MEHVIHTPTPGASLADTAVKARASAQPKFRIKSEEAIPPISGLLDMTRPQASMRHNERSLEDLMLSPISGMEQADVEAFFAQRVAIQISPPQSEIEPPAVKIGVNGDERWLPRGVPILIQRSFVEVLARSREIRFIQMDNRDPNSDDRKTTTTSGRSPYSFGVIFDPAGEFGRKWLEKVLSQKN